MEWCFVVSLLVCKSFHDVDNQFLSFEDTVNMMLCAFFWLYETPMSKHTEHFSCSYSSGKYKQAQITQFFQKEQTHSSWIDYVFCCRLWSTLEIIYLKLMLELDFRILLFVKHSSIF
jgi:hypothetical protein